MNKSTTPQQMNMKIENNDEIELYLLIITIILVLNIIGKFICIICEAVKMHNMKIIEQYEKTTDRM